MRFDDLKRASSPRGKMFKQSLVSFSELPSVTTDEGRYYTTPSGLVYPSVTTVLGKKLDHSGLDEWRERVGEEEANRTSNLAKTRGTAVHLLAERYVLNDPDWARGAMPINLNAFRGVRRVLDEHVSTVVGVELPLYSDELKTAGRTDLSAAYDRRLSMIDFKTSKRPKKPEWIESYFLQLTTYSVMFTERMRVDKGIELTRLPQIVVIVAVDDSEPQVFARDPGQYLERVRELFC